MRSLTARLIARKVEDGECWRYRGAHDSCGYGRMSLRGRSESTHRAAWIAFRGEPGDAHVLHKPACRFRDCFNPAHLELGTHGENMRQRDDWGHGIRGESVATAKMAAAQVLEARELKRSQPSLAWSTLAQTYGVAEATIRQAVQGKTWRHLEGAVH